MNAEQALEKGDSQADPAAIPGKADITVGNRRNQATSESAYTGQCERQERLKACSIHGLPSRLLAEEVAAVGRRRIEMLQCRQLLVRLRAGDTVREIARSGLMGRDKLGELRAVALASAQGG